MSNILYAILLVPTLLAGCEDPAANKPRALTSDPAIFIAAPSGEIRGVALRFAPDDSRVEFAGSKVTGKHDGGFRSFSGFIDLVNGNPEESSVSVDIDMSSVYTDADGPTKHLQHEDFFAINRFPRSTFVSTGIRPDAEKGAGNYLVTGDLEMRGQRRSVTFPASIAVNGEEVSVESEFAINRKDFGMVYTGKADDLIRDDVVIKLDIRGLPQP